MADSSRLTIALAGNPNAGKTTIFNALTGARLHVGNYAGVTVEKTEGQASHNGVDLTIVDLPGTYSMTAYSMEEIVARNFIIDEAPDVVVHIVDASNLERNLYLTTQLLELGAPLVLAFNMMDVAKRRGMDIDVDQLSRLLGVPVVAMVGHKGEGLDAMLDAAVRVGQDGAAASVAQRKPEYGGEVEPHVKQLTELIDRQCGEGPLNRWFAVKMLEEDSETTKRLAGLCGEQIEAVSAEATRLREHLASVCGDRAEIILADRRYGFISGACTESVRKTVEARHDISDKIDAVLTHQVMGAPIFAAMMYLTFHLVFSVGAVPVGWMEHGLGWLSATVGAMWPAGDESLLRSLVVEGVIGGVGGVLMFVPNIVLLFGAVAVLEDTGYMARAAFIMDKLMHKIGLHGKSFIPMLTGFGCSVPAILATRTLESRRDRLVTMLVLPLMSCGARLPIYVLLVPAFFAWRWQPVVMCSIYLVGIVLAVICAKVLRSTLFKGESEPFVMELPPYRFPTLKGLLLHAWEPTRMYIRKAGTVILGFSIVMWAVVTFPRKEVVGFDVDYAARQAVVEQDFFTAVAGLNEPLGLSADSTVLVDWVRADRVWADAQETYRSYPGQLAESKTAHDQAVKALLAGPDGAVLARFIDVRRQILDVQAEQESLSADGEAIASPAAVAMQLTPLRSMDPILFSTVTRYLDEIASTLADRTEELANLQARESLEYTIAGRIGRAMAPALRPLGFDWKIGTGLIGALGAKEVFVAQMGVVYAVGEVDESSDALRAKLRADYSPLVGYCIMLFCLITAPCVATVVMTGRESGSWKWAVFQVVGMTVLAYVVTGAVYQIGSLLTKVG